ncbi:MAG: glycerol-3-phosphate 1-O-acyltransferase PlsY [Candidatus Latescibacteria bacterium]|nr:glycerol-3-phosphate 1-O-acyltransferase PlsY [Candidatus Latescibacterota bacterium]
MLILVLLASYLLGSFPTSIVVGRVLKGIDIRQYGSGNAGATNAFRVLGPAAGVFVFVVDFAKGMVAVLLFAKLAASSPLIDPELMQILAAVAVVSGHIWTVFAGFKGGKGVGHCCWSFTGISTSRGAIAFAVWTAVTLCTGYVSLGSLSAAVVLPLCLSVEKLALNRPVSVELLIFVCLLAGLIIFTHRSNIRRLLRGEENRFGSKRFRGTQRWKSQ